MTSFHTTRCLHHIVTQLSNIPKPQDVPWAAGRFHDLSNSNSLNIFNLIELPRLTDMIFEGKTLAERTAVVGASEETLKAPSWSCNSWSSSVANLFPGLRAENQGGRSHCASTWSTLGTQVLIFSLLPLNLRAHHLLHLFRFGCRKEKGRGQGKPTSQKKKGKGKKVKQEQAEPSVFAALQAKEEQDEDDDEAEDPEEVGEV